MIFFLFCIGFGKVAELLIQNGADVNIMGDRNRTALITAVKKSAFNGW